MRYWKGSIALSPTQDYPLLRRVLRSTFITHRQLYDFMRLEYCTWSRHSFNNRVLRLVKHNYLVRDEVPFKTDGYVYSISEVGASEAIGLGECYTGATQRPKDVKLPKAVYHAIDLNEIHLALKRSGLLVEWTSDTELRSRNELASVGYSKDYDAVVTVRVNGSERKFALEYERTPKTRKDYLRISSEIEGEKLVDRFLYLAPNHDLLAFLIRSFASSRRAIYFGLLKDFLNWPLDAPLRTARPGATITLQNVLRVG
ncbi:MAG TPA: hypothetical protein VF772_06215 [Terriglobales bacterium]